MNTRTASLLGRASLAAFALFNTAHAATPESLCELDGTPVPECVTLLRQADAATDDAARADFTKRANEAYKSALNAKDAKPARFEFEPIENEKGPPLQAYRSHASFSLLMCRMSYDLSVSERQLGYKPSAKGDFPGCLRAASEKARALLTKASLQVKSPAAKQALKDFHVAYMTALEGISPKVGELKSGYTARQAALDDSVNAAWARFDIER